MKRLSIFLACMLAFSIATTADNAILNLKKIEKSRFGRNILDTIQLQLTTSDQIDRLVSDLENISQDVERDQVEDKEKNDRLQSDCSADISRLQGEIQEANLKVVEASADIADNTPILEQKKILLQEKKESYSVNQQLLQQLEDHYKQKQSEYQLERDEHSHAESVIRKAKEVLQGSFGTRSFLEIKKPSAKSLVEVAVHFSESAKTHYKRKSWNSFFRILSQISSSAPVQADAGALQRLFEIIDELLEKIATSLEIEAKAFGQFESDYENNRDQYIIRITDLQKIIGELEVESQALWHRLDQDAHVKNTQEKRAAEKTAELDTRNAFCIEQQHQYEARAADRTEQLSIIHQVLDIINSQLRVLKKYVSDRNE